MDVKKFSAGSLPKVSLIIAVIGAIGCILGFFQDRVGFAFSYLTSFTFFLCLSLGALWFVMIQHLTRAGWSVVVRRIAENISGNLQWAWLLILPLIGLSIHDLFHWSHACSCS